MSEAREKMKVELLSITPDAEILIERAGRTCYQSEKAVTIESAREFIPKLIKMGHESPLEHAYATFRVTGGSRAMTHQLVRHRLCSFSQQSQRYVSETNFEYVVPESVPAEMVDDFKADMESIRQMYIRWKDRGLKSEDARFVLPNACTSEIVISANFRQFRHIFRLRCDKHAQWEIRAICRDMLFKLYNVAPSVFQDVLDKVVEQDRQVPDR